MVDKQQVIVISSQSTTTTTIIIESDISTRQTNNNCSSNIQQTTTKLLSTTITSSSSSSSSSSPSSYDDDGDDDDNDNDRQHVIESDDDDDDDCQQQQHNQYKRTKRVIIEDPREYDNCWWDRDIILSDDDDEEEEEENERIQTPSSSLMASLIAPINSNFFHPHASTSRIHAIEQILEEQRKEFNMTTEHQYHDGHHQQQEKIAIANGPSASTIHRPMALKVIRPIPQRATEAFYNAIYKDKDISADDVHNAMIDVNDWHRKWTHQDEDSQLYNANLIRMSTVVDQAVTSLPLSDTLHTLHTLHSREDNNSNDGNDDVQDDMDAMLWSDFVAADRERGARNPSPSINHSFDDNDDVNAEINDNDNDEGCDDEDNDCGYNNSPGYHIFVPRAKRSRDGVNDDVRSELVLQRRYGNSNNLNAGSFVSTLSLPNNNEEDDGPYQSSSSPSPYHQQLNSMLVRPQPVRVGPTTTGGGDGVLARPVALRPNEIQSKNEEQQRPPIVKLEIHTIYGDDDDINSNGSYNSHHLRSMSPLTVSTISVTVGRHQQQQQHYNDDDDDQQNNIATTTAAVEDQEELHVIEADDEDDNCDMIVSEKTASFTTSWILEPKLLPMALFSARDGLLHSLVISGGDTASEHFQSCLSILHENYISERCRMLDDAAVPRFDKELEDGLWLTLTKPTFFGNLGDNDNNDPMYTLGRMSFDMFAPTNVICSLQGNFNSVHNVAMNDQKKILETNRSDNNHYCAIPKKFKEINSSNDENESSNTMKTYDIITPFTIEPDLAAYPDALNRDVIRPIRGIMTTYGYTLQDPNDETRRSVWITGGKIEPNNDDDDHDNWMSFFQKHPPTYSFGQKAKLLAVKLLMGATVPAVDPITGIMEYTFTRPLGGHGMAYVDTLYCDKTLRIVKGHRGTIFVFTRMPNID